METSHFAKYLRALLIESGVFSRSFWVNFFTPANADEKGLAEMEERMESWFGDEDLPTPEELRGLISFTADPERQIAEAFMRSSGRDQEWEAKLCAMRDAWQRGESRHAFQEARDDLLRMMRGDARSGYVPCSAPAWKKAKERVPAARCLAEYVYLPRLTEQLLRFSRDAHVEALEKIAKLGIDDLLKEELEACKSCRLVHVGANAF